ncbi:MAG: zinc ABC transporter substrate-binding protein [Desulfobacterales bacterium]|nr:zinc ABC transporter substrate-binding protein [Desulfobacterales bacterium]MBF0395665.1 zinc ABC transporter substrate-binding protein [Desulfobacterales bacterium]
MRRIFLIILFLNCAIFANADDKLKIITTIFPLYDFTKEIGREKIDVTILLPPGIEAHSFSPTPLDIMKLNKADILIYTSKYMEPWIEDIIKALENKKLIIIDSSLNIELLKESGHKHQVDPHIWLNPIFAKKIVFNISNGLSSKDLKNKEFYLNNLIEYNNKLDILDINIRDKLKNCKHNEIFYGGHFAFGYFAKEYGLKHKSPYKGFSPNAEPSSKGIADLVKKMKKSQIKTIYYEELIDPKVAKAISEETGANMFMLHGVHNITKDDMKKGSTYLSIMYDNIEKLKIGLECR